MIVPKRSSLVTGAAQSLKNAIESGELSDHLPNVRTLSAKLCVSVPTVVAAVKVLVQDGYVQARQGCATKVVYSGHRSSPSPGLPKIVLLGFGFEDLATSSHYRDLVDHLRKLNFEVEVQQFSIKSWQQGKSAFAKNIAHRNVACWVLADPPAGVPKWFADQKLPTLISSGIAGPDVSLPDFEIDFSALYRHCANQMLNLGHERVLLLMEEHSAAKNPQSISAFVDMVRQRFPSVSATDVVKTHDGTPEDCELVLERLFSRKKRPTAICVSWVHYYVLTQTWLQSRGYRIPEDIALVCRDCDDTLLFLRPTPAHYRLRSQGTIFRRFARAILAVVEKTSVEEHTLVLPEFVPGASLGRRKK